MLICFVGLAGCAQKPLQIGSNPIDPQSSSPISEGEFTITEVGGEKCLQPNSALIEKCKKTGIDNVIVEQSLIGRIGCYPSSTTSDVGKSCADTSECEGYCEQQGAGLSCTSFKRNTLYLPHYISIATLHLCKGVK